MVLADVVVAQLLGCFFTELGSLTERITDVEALDVEAVFDRFDLGSLGRGLKATGAAPLPRCSDYHSRAAAALSPCDSDCLDLRAACASLDRTSPLN